MQQSAMHNSAEFFLHSAKLFCCKARSQNKNISAFVTAVKATVYKKRTIGDLAYFMGVI
jgi:hypothetical protein